MGTDLPPTLVDALAALRAGTLSSVELTAACIERARVAQPQLNAFLSLEADAALASASASDEARARAARGAPAPGLLHGVPLAHKDMYYRAGKVATCGSRIRRDWVAPVTATALARLEAARHAWAFTA
jgi:aspartyl-tRNA(Asn)/glutamyl-tRNA(Gln) amidotransferase subunit A